MTTEAGCDIVEVMFFGKKTTRSRLRIDLVKPYSQFQNMRKTEKDMKISKLKVRVEIHQLKISAILVL